jgi:hypothetical protein
MMESLTEPQVFSRQAQLGALIKLEKQFHGGINWFS